VLAAQQQGRLVDVSRAEVAVLAPLVALILVLGFYPKPVLDVITPSVSATLTELGVPADLARVAAGEGTR